ncbi:hypothetical protein AQUCO_00600173v1 [Aquilegia coerulea]|uniref:Filament-like plant protein 4 n=1 Tax=Aquilegia coerulea TaxID=218851 RepID=A0A2G5ENG7_AQUCA|nr:hypothetical protein AQUCO_00600173v1 [Aquilegia coerulea]PIA57251.1 hypothetical protein AQUCO_00600173v1 [Aquilegia coerulea]PIA57252.1 hypothetical protein AQUCO_00600173v1 [Aquilegia coerulea]
MERRSWPWKKKSSDKTAEKTLSAVESSNASLASVSSQGDQDKPKKPSYVQISVESYAHLTGLEDEVKTLNDQVNTLNEEVDVLNEKLSSAQSEMTNKENIVKQHAKVAEEAVSGWEKAEAEALALKHQLESVTLLKLTAEDRAAHLDGALKECMRQIRSLKEEHEKKLHETIVTKTKYWEKIKHDFEAKINNLDQELLRSSAENSALSRALQERSNMLMKANEERSQAEAEIELLKNDIQSSEKEINSLKYELHIVSKELDIRNEEKNMSMRSAEVANKQHLEGVKKIAKLEAECQRLRGLVRKKLPGPAALAQMKLEVESLGRDYGDIRPRRSPVQNPSPHLAPPPEISLENVQQCHKENDFLMGRCLAMEEEMKMLKEALAKRNSELQASRNMCATTMSKLRNLEAQVQVSNQQRSSPRLIVEIPAEGSLSRNGSNPPSMMSLSEDGIDEEGSCVESWATTSVSELSQFKKGRNIEKHVKAENMNQLELMDDFLEMERLACSTDSNGPVSNANSSTNLKTENEDSCSLADVSKAGDLASALKLESDSSLKVPCIEESPSEKKDFDKVSLSKLHSRISMILESEAKESDTRKILDDIKDVMQDIQDALPPHSANCIIAESRSAAAVDNQKDTQDNEEGTDSGIALIHDSKQGTPVDHIVDHELVTAIYQIHDFVLSLRKEATAIHDISPGGIIEKSEEFSDCVNRVLSQKTSLEDFVLNLSHVVAKVSELNINLFCSKGSEGENNSSDCIDKVTLLEKKVVQDDSSRERFSNGCPHISHTTSEPEGHGEGSLCPGFDMKFASCKCALEELEHLKSERDNMEVELSRCTQNLEQTNFQLQDTEKLLTELKLQLASCQKSNSLAETQLKCMAESYNTLEMRAYDLDAEVKLLHGKLEALDIELKEEKLKSQDALVQCKDLEEQLQRNESCTMCASKTAEADEKSQKEKEIAAATEKLAECQETIFLLGKQLKALRPSEHTGSSYLGQQETDGFMEDGKGPGRLYLQGLNSSHDFDYSETEAVTSPFDARVGSESPSDIFNTPLSPSNTDPEHIRSPVGSKLPKHRPTKSSSSSSTTTPEKHSRGISRFFSAKSKSAQ